VSPTASYDEIAGWHEHEFLAQSRGLPEHPLGIDRALSTLLATGSGPCLEIGCGTGEWAALVRELGRTPFGVDLSAGMLGYAKGRLPVARADAQAACSSMSASTHASAADAPIAQIPLPS
jgi:SAM-dependent methyltransferase